jgi:hypothetical protein
MILEQSDHRLSAGGALLMTHLEGITDRLRDLKSCQSLPYGSVDRIGQPIDQRIDL